MIGGNHYWIQRFESILLQQLFKIIPMLQHNLRNNYSFFDIQVDLLFKSKKVCNLNSIYMFNLSSIYSNFNNFNRLYSLKKSQFNSVQICKDILQIFGNEKSHSKAWIQQFSKKQQEIQIKLTKRITIYEKYHLFCEYKQNFFKKEPFAEATLIIIACLVQISRDVLAKEISMKDVWAILTQETLNDIIMLCQRKNIEFQNINHRIEDYFYQVHACFKQFIENIRQKVRLMNDYEECVPKTNYPLFIPRQEEARNDQVQTSLDDETVRHSSYDENEPSSLMYQYSLLSLQSSSSQSQKNLKPFIVHELSMEDQYLREYDYPESQKSRLVKVEDHMLIQNMIRQVPLKKLKQDIPDIEFSKVLQQIQIEKQANNSFRSFEDFKGQLQSQPHQLQSAGIAKVFEEENSFQDNHKNQAAIINSRIEQKSALSCNIINQQCEEPSILTPNHIIQEIQVAFQSIHQLLEKQQKVQIQSLWFEDYFYNQNSNYSLNYFELLQQQTPITQYESNQFEQQFLSKLRKD